VTAARLKAVAGAVECVAVAASLYFRPPVPAIDFLPGTSVVWAVVFLLGAAGLAYAGTTGYPRAILACLATGSTLHACLCFSLAGTAIAAGVGWIAAGMAGLLAFCYAVEAARVARWLP